MSKVGAWFQFAKSIWLSLSLGWAALILSAFLPYSASQGGALLICAVIVAEVFDRKGYRYAFENLLPGFHTDYRFYEVHGGADIKHGVKVVPTHSRSGSITYNTDKWPIFHMAAKGDFRETSEGKIWIWELTVSRADRAIRWSLVVSAIAGTLFAAFFA